MEQEVRRMAKIRRMRMATHARRRGEQRPAAGSMEGRPAAKTKGKRCGPKITKGVKRPAASSMEERPAAKKKGKRHDPKPPADPMPGAPMDGVVAGPEGGQTFDKYASERPCSPDGPIIRLGSDCSGLDSPKIALDLMGLGSRVEVRFCSDKLATCRAFLKAAHCPKILYTNADKKGAAEAPEVDLYTAGFPCQPWSAEGKQRGFKDPSGQGRVFDHIATYIKEREPKAFLLENVAALASKTHEDAFAEMLRTLRGSGRYFVSWRKLNCLDFGLPQNRARIYIVGVRRDAFGACTGITGFPWPKKKNLAPVPLKRFLCGGRALAGSKLSPGQGWRLEKAKKIIADREGNPSTEPWVVEISSGRSDPTVMLGHVPCLTRTRAAGGGHWITELGRFLTVEEILNLMGLPVSVARTARLAGLTDVQIAQMAGNAIPTNILMILLARILTMMGLQGSGQA